MLKAFWVALQFLTRIPIPSSWLPDHYDETLLGKSVVAYPAVGLLIGLLLYGLAWLLQDLPTLVLAALLLLFWVLITGALHIDGLADSADAWVGGQGNAERTLAIMKDAYTGPVGVAAVVVVLLVKFAALASLSSGSLALVFVPLLARSGVVVLFLTTPYVRTEGLGASQAQHLPRQQAYLILLFTMALVGLFTGWAALKIVVLLGLVFFLLRQLMMQRISGTTGDTAGAMIEILEMTSLILWLM